MILLFYVIAAAILLLFLDITFGKWDEAMLVKVWGIIPAEDEKPDTRAGIQFTISLQDIEACLYIPNSTVKVVDTYDDLVWVKYRRSRFLRLICGAKFVVNGMEVDAYAR